MSSVKTKNLTPLYAFIQGLYWMNFAAIMGYSGFYLLGSGFSNTEIGIIIAIAGILSAVLQPVLASYADRPESPSLKKFLQLLLVLQLILGISLLFCKSILLTGVVYGCGVTLLQLLTPFINSPWNYYITHRNYSSTGMHHDCYTCTDGLSGTVSIYKKQLSADRGQQ